MLSLSLSLSFSLYSSLSRSLSLSLFLCTHTHMYIYIYMYIYTCIIFYIGIHVDIYTHHCYRQLHHHHQLTSGSDPVDSINHDSSSERTIATAGHPTSAYAARHHDLRSSRGLSPKETLAWNGILRNSKVTSNIGALVIRIGF